MATQNDSGRTGPPAGTDASAGPTGRKSRRRLVKVIIVFALIAVVLPVAVFYIGSYIDAARAGNPFEIARKAGIPVSFADPFYQKWGDARPISAEENAAIYYEEAFAILPRILDAATRGKLPMVGDLEMPDDPRVAFEPDTVAAMREFVQANAKVLDLLHKGAGVPECYFSIYWSGFATNLPHLKDSRQAARVLAVKMCADIEDGTPHEAVQSALDGLALGKALTNEPTLICGLTGLAIDSIVLGTGTERLLSRTDPPNEDLATLQAAFSKAAEELSFRAAFIGEVAFQQDFYDRLRSGQPTVGPGGAGQSPLLKPFLLLGGPYITANQKRGLRLMLELIDAVTNPTPENMSDAHWVAWQGQGSSKRYVFCRMMVPGLSRAIGQCEMTRARLRAAAASCAAMRYRNDTGKWPESLETLVPAYLDKAPLDPFTGKPLLYKVDEKGITVYSVGRNQIDEGGKPYLVPRPPDVRPSVWDKYDDAGFRVWKAAEPPSGKGE